MGSGRSREGGSSSPPSFSSQIASHFLVFFLSLQLGLMHLVEEMENFGWMTLNVPVKRNLLISVPTDLGARATVCHIIKLAQSVKCISVNKLLSLSLQYLAARYLVICTT